jgi:hypothetical protein
VTSPEREPVKLVAVVAVVAEVADVAVVAFPDKFAVMVPALKFPDASLFTIADAVFRFVAAFASTEPEATLAAVCPPTEDTTVDD